MKETVTIIKCDICKNKIKENECITLTIPIKFLTNQTDGIYCEPYIQMNKLDICKECLMKITNIEATGAMGFNEYRFIHEK